VWRGRLHRLHFHWPVLRLGDELLVFGGRLVMTFGYRLSSRSRGSGGRGNKTGEVVKEAGAEVERSRGPAGRLHLHALVLCFSLLAATT
jgi:hypothetical protein